MTTYRAPVTPVQIGNLSIPGLLLEDGSFAIAVPQIAEMTEFQFLKNNAQRDIKALLGKGFQFLKSATELNPKPVNVLSLRQFETLLLELALKGNQTAATLVRQLVGLSLHQLFSDAFGIKFEAEDRQEYLVIRQTCRETHHPEVTSWWKQDGIYTGLPYASRTQQLKRAFGLDPKKKVDDMTTEELFKWNNAQTRYHNARIVGQTHKGAIDYLKEVAAR